jgi:hypothetical protein
MATEPLPGDYPITLYRGDTRVWTFAFLEDDQETTIDLTGKTWESEVRSATDASPVLLTFTIDDTDAADGVIVVTLPATAWDDVDIGSTAPTSKWFWDLQSTEAGVVRTWVKGKVKVLWDVTR